MEKVLCEGSGKLPFHLKQRPGGLGVFGKCGSCERILVPTKDGPLRQHQPRTANTASMDKTRDILWGADENGSPVG